MSLSNQTRRITADSRFILGGPVPLCWFRMLCEDSGPCDGGTTLFFCTAMLGIEPGIPMLSLNPLLVPFSPPLFNFYFEMPSGACSHCERCRELPPASAVCPSVQTNREITHSILNQRNGDIFRFLKRFYLLSSPLRLRRFWVIQVLGEAIKGPMSLVCCSALLSLNIAVSL